MSMWMNLRTARDCCVEARDATTECRAPRGPFARARREPSRVRTRCIPTPWHWRERSPRALSCHSMVAPVAGRKVMRRCQWVASRCAVLLSLLLPTSFAHADPVYRCRNARGQIAYQDRACGAGEQQSEITLDPPPAPPAAGHESAHASRARASPRPRVARHPRAGAAARAETSWQCRAADGSVFYRHGRCPRTIAAHGASPGTKGGKGVATVGVSATPLPRAEACRRLARERGRSGREHDEVVSTYERNAGRDPCR